MKISVDLERLWAEVNRISEGRVEYDPSIRVSVPEVIARLKEGIEIRIEDIRLDGGLLSYEGAQVLLYIPDQGRNFHEVVENPETGRRFHVAHCQTLEDMRQKGRFSRYVVTNNLGGVFKITGEEPQTNRALKGEASLRVCMNCLKHLNYEDYLNAGRKQKAIWGDFSIAAFFEKFSTQFRYMPDDVIQDRNPSVYTDDWKEISARLREQYRWTCQECSVDLASHRELLHVHHINGVRADNRTLNLRVLCKDCHRKQPGHDTMFMRASEMQKIREARRSQQIVAEDWDEALRLANTAVEGALQVARARGFAAPTIGFELSGRSGAVEAEFEAAWEDRKIAIVVENANEPVANPGGWKTYRAVDFIQEFGR
jgi:hypothetical protein